MSTSHANLPMRALIVDDEIDRPTAAGRALSELITDLGAGGVAIIAAASVEDAKAIVKADAGLQCVIVDWDIGENDHSEAAKLVSEIRDNYLSLPIFLLADRDGAASVPGGIMEHVDDFVWLLEDTAEFITGRIINSIRRFQAGLLPPMFRALADFAEVHEYSWHTPGHTGGTAFLKSPVGRTFFSFFGEQMFRSDLSVSVGELGSLLDHSGPIGAGERNAARVFGGDRTYYVTNGTSTSNRVVVMASVTRGQVALCDRNCHKSIEHAMTLSGAIPTYLVPTRNHLGIIGPVPPERLKKKAVTAAIAANPLVGPDPTPRLSILTNSTYDGLCYDITRVEKLLGGSVDRMLFDEAWYGYARFNPVYKGRFAMHDARAADGPTVFATQSTHKLLAALSQASMIHVRDGRQPIPHDRFNEAFMMHASTSPQYAILASNDVSAAMMDGAGGRLLTSEAIREAVAFRQMMARLKAEHEARGDWFFGVWQPDTVVGKGDKRTPFHEVEPERLLADTKCWLLEPNADWHGFGGLDEGYCLLDPIKVSVVTPRSRRAAIPAPVLSAYLDALGILPEKTGSHTVLFLFSIGVTKGKWGTLVNAFLKFKSDYDANSSLARTLPELAERYPKRYGTIGLRDLCGQVQDKMTEEHMDDRLEQGFATLPVPVCSPVEAYERLVRGEVERVPLARMAGRVAATGIVPYPPGIPLLMPGEKAGAIDGGVLGYLTALEAFDAAFPGFEHENHGIELIDGKYHALCLQDGIAT